MSFTRRRAVSVLLVAAAVFAGSNQAGADSSCWLPPVVGDVADPFRAPACHWCPGNRGIEYRVGHQVPVRAVASGTVAWAGRIASVGYVVVRHADGRRATYGHVDDVRVGRGDPVVARMRLGTATGTFHFGLRAGERYVDPSPHLGRLVGVARLVPLDGTPARPAPAPRVRCGTRISSR